GRFQSAREVADLLQRYQAELEAHGTVVPVPLRPAGPKRSRGVGFAAVAAVALVLAGLLVYSLTRRPPAGSGQPHTDPSKADPGARADPWRPRAPVTPDELARMSSPFDALDRAKLPTAASARMFGGADRVPPELVGVLDGSP